MKEMTDSKNFYHEVMQPGLVLVYFTGPQCQRCKALEPRIKKLGEKYPFVKMLKMDITGQRRFCMSIGVMSLPTIMFFKNRKFLKTFTTPEAENIQNLENFIMENS